MLLPILSILFGLVLLVWSAERFIAGASNTARYLGMPPLLIGILVVGFGTSAPEVFVSILSASQGNPGVALGNAYGSNITNIALILGLSAMIQPIAFNSKVLRMELPILTGVTLLSAVLLYDGELQRSDAQIMLALTVLLIGWSHWQGMKDGKDSLAGDVKKELQERGMSIGVSVAWLLAGLVLLIGSSRLLVWGAVDIASRLGVSDLLIGLTIVAVGTSLPELASTILATRRGEPDIALGNVIGSNLFNTIGVVGLIGVIRPFPVGHEVFSRDIMLMLGLTLSLFIIGWAWRGPGKGRVSRIDGVVLLCIYVAYNSWLVFTAMH
ncbi:MAG: calcium/sodium antiporter [Planctomycetales bacterium]|nr:calcium/sodium antiporter [bacterium]UNM08152.1 MAG: calcium/sodium antiporter [Planctomycetales bacterium]